MKCLEMYNCVCRSVVQMSFYDAMFGVTTNDDGVPFAGACERAEQVGYKKILLILVDHC